MTILRYALSPAFALLLSLAACNPPPRPPAPGPEARKAVDTATTAYAKCITDGVQAVPVGRVPGTVVAEVVKACAPAREALAQKIMVFHKIGHPKFTPAQLRAVADASIDTIQPELTAAGVAAYIEQGPSNPKAE